MSSSPPATHAVPATDLDSFCDSSGFAGHSNDDWSDVKHSERTTRDRILENHVVIKLIKKSDWEGFKRLVCHLGILYLTGWTVWRVWMWEAAGSEGLTMTPSVLFFLSLKCVLLLLVLFLHGFVLQCLSYCCQHETLHRTAFKTGAVNTAVSFLASLPCFEFSTHEKLMHKSHHTWTNDPDKDPELTSFFMKEDSKKIGFRKVPFTKTEYWEELFCLHRTLFSHWMRIFNCALGNPVDYSGVKWAPLPEDARTKVKPELQMWALTHIAVYVLVGGVGLANWMECRQTSISTTSMPFPVLPILTPTHYLLLWLLPATLGFIPINLIRNAEHADVSPDQNCLTNTRSCKSSSVIRFLTWNMILHREHHLYPMVPFYNLPQLREELEKVAEKLSQQESSENIAKAHSIMRSTKPDGFWQTNRKLYGEWIDKQARGEPVKLKE